MPQESVVIVDPNRLFREGLRRLLEQAHYCVAGETSLLEESLERDLSGVDVVVWTLDARSSGGADVEAIRRARLTRPALRFVALTEALSREAVARAMAAGVDAFLSKDITVRVLAHAIELVLLGQQIFPPQLVQLLAASELGRADDISDSPAMMALPPPVPEDHLPAEAQVSRPAVVAGVGGEVSLSEREGQILRLLGGGKSNKVIARELGISEATVKVHVKGLLRKVRVANRTQAAIWGLNHYDQPPT